MHDDETRPRRRWRLILSVAAALAVLAMLAALLLWRARPRITEGEVRAAIYSTIQRESPASFLVTGYLDVNVTGALSQDRRLVIPLLPDVDLGTTSTTVRMPGRVSYGFDVGDLDPEMIVLHGDSLIDVALPPLAVHAVEPRLGEMEVRTSEGWMRRFDEAEVELQRHTQLAVQNAMRRQAVAHLQDSAQPRINSALAVERMLLPVLTALGLEDARVRVQVSPRVLVQPER